MREAAPHNVVELKTGELKKRDQNFEVNRANTKFALRV